MPVLSVQSPHAQVSLRSERLVVLRHDAGEQPPKSEVPLGELERVVFAEGVLVSAPALCELLKRQIPVTFLAWNGRLLGSFEPPGPPRGASRMLQYQLTSTPSACLALAVKLVQAKIANGRRLLQRLDSNHHCLEPGAFDGLEARERDATHATDLPSLLGSEGAAAVVFYEAWSRFLPAQFPFGQRSTRPPGNPVNACLSYLSALVYGELLSACVVRGLDPALGCLHQPQDGRWSLPLDLMEPFRPALIEALTLRLFSHRILQPPHFEAHEDGVWLTRDGRRTLIQHYEQRVQREFLSEHAGCRTTLRQQLQHAALQFKLALAQPQSYAPFRLN
ncbi:MAG: CRISPR-associated endonuclease Cas1 [Verrucomicrobiota bacterium]|jgi:CRISPR-associated endonuclease Cas1